MGWWRRRKIIESQKSEAGKGASMRPSSPTPLLKAGIRIHAYPNVELITRVKLDQVEVDQANAVARGQSSAPTAARVGDSDPGS